MPNIFKAAMGRARHRVSQLFVSQLPLQSPKHPPSPGLTTEEPDYYRPGGFHPVSLGDVFYGGRYTVLRKLGYGQYSTVWLARDSKYQRYVALKLLRADCYGGPHDIFEREILSRILQISHKTSHQGRHHALPLLEHFDHTGPNGEHVCLAFDVLDHHLGFQVAKHKYGRLPVKSVRMITRQVLLGLDFLHRECGIIHTDLKPTNILLELETPHESISNHLQQVPPRMGDGPDGAKIPLREAITTRLVSEMASPHVRIVDFGVASWRNKHLSELIQSPALRAPEVTIGAPWDTGVDIWSLGCLVVEFAQGFVLFPGQASERGTWTAEDDHLARMIEILGPFPPDLLNKGSRTAKFFDKTGALVRIPNMGSTSLERLINGAEMPLCRPAEMSESEVGVFIDFIKGMLTIDPEARKSAAELLQHEWMQTKEHSKTWIHGHFIMS